MTKEQEDRIKQIIAAHGTVEIVFEAVCREIFDIVEDIVEDAKQKAWNDGFADGRSVGSSEH